MKFIEQILATPVQTFPKRQAQAALHLSRKQQKRLDDQYFREKRLSLYSWFRLERSSIDQNS